MIPEHNSSRYGHPYRKSSGVGEIEQTLPDPQICDAGITFNHGTGRTTATCAEHGAVGPPLYVFHVVKQRWTHMPNVVG